MASDAVKKNDAFGDVLDNQLSRLRKGFDPGERVSGTVTAIDRNGVFVDINARCEGIIDRTELENDEGELTVAVGDTVEAYFLGGREDELRLTTRISGGADTEMLFNAYQAGIPVEGRVESEINGGFQVNVSGNRGFCPYSQIDVHRQEPGLFIGQTLLFDILEFDEHRGDLVLSRRQLLEREREKNKEELKKSLSEDDIVEGTVTKLMPFGAFVDLGGIDGLIPISQLAWGHTEKPEDIVSVGEKVRVLIRDIDWDRERISLSLRHAQGDPWQDLSYRYHVGMKVEGRVVRLMPFGAFVELEPGVDGLVHISKLGAGRRVNHPKEVVSEGDTVAVSIEKIDLDERRIGLSMEDTGAAASEEEQVFGSPEDVRPGATITGRVDGIKDFGVFVELPGEQTGLLHISEIDLGSTRDKEGALKNKFPLGSTIRVTVKKIEGDRIGLTLSDKANTAGAEQRTDVRDFMKDSGDAGLGSLGDALDGLDL